MKTASMQRLLTHQHVLLLQGKMGKSFHRIAAFLREQGLNVSKINFNAGDKHYYRHQGAVDYTGTVAGFSDWLDAFIQNNAVDAVVCFGDCRPHHLEAGKLCNGKGISFFVFEEGYIRPDYITFEEFGINGYSRLDADKIHTLPKPAKNPLVTNNRFYRMAVSAIVYYIITQLGQKDFPHYYHYRNMTAWQEAKAWLRAFRRKWYYYIPDKVLLNRYLVNNLDKQYFLVCLQVHKDTQVTYHSDYDDVHEFIDEVVESFAKHADKKHCLVFKHHPLDRGHRDYRQYFKKLVKQYGLEDRLYYGVDMHLPTMIRHSLGMITINSTTGLQSIYHKIPTKAMGRAIYNIERLTDQQPLDSFWHNPKQPDHEFYLRFREYLIAENQLNGSFYGDSPWMSDYAVNSETNLAGALAIDDSKLANKPANKPDSKNNGSESLSAELISVSSSAQKNLEHGGISP